MIKYIVAWFIVDLMIVIYRNVGQCSSHTVGRGGKFVFNDPVVLQFLDQLFQTKDVPPQYENIFKANIEEILA